MCQVLGIDAFPVPTDARGRLDLAELDQLLATGRVGTVVATAGTTGLGAVDQVQDIVQLARKHGARVHVDSAYGGFFTLLAGPPAPAVEPATVAGHRRRGLGRHRPAQTRAPALRLRRGPVSRPERRPLLRP